MPKHHFSYFDAFVRDAKDMERTNNFSEQAGLLPNSDAANFMKNVVYSFFSKEGVITDFLEGLQDLVLTRNGHETLSMLLGRTRAQIIDIWAYELETPKFSDFNNLDDYCIAMKEHVTLQKSCHMEHDPIEKTRMCLKNFHHCKRLKTLCFKKFEIILLQKPMQKIFALSCSW